jgi:3-deoxy-D-manno-oct-2-ulosonic acid (Kdo) hydroxylase
MGQTCVMDCPDPAVWAETSPREERVRWCCEQLEEGQILQFDHIPFELPEADRLFLLALQQGSSRFHKNISYRPRQDLLRGFSSDQPADVERMHDCMRRYSAEVTQFLSRVLTPYAAHWSLDYASFRPLEEAGRVLPLHQRNDLLHVDAFPSRPTHGGRILRVFTNLNPDRPRVWMTTDRFDVLARRYASEAGLPQIAAQGPGGMQPLRRGFAALKRAVGLRAVERSPYDRFMLRFHDYLKENEEFQKSGSQTRLEFAPHSTWIVFTDAVPHAALAGQFALEQTYIVPVAALLDPQKAPIRVLESLCGRPLAQ